MPTVRPSEGQSFETSDENSDKNSGKQSKQKRKASELEEDKLLWAKLKSGAQITRNKRQEKRLRELKEKVASQHPGCKAIDERKVECFCGKVFAINKQNAIKDVRRAHVGKCMQATSDKQQRPKIYRNIGSISLKSERLYFHDERMTFHLFKDRLN